MVEVRSCGYRCGKLIMEPCTVCVQKMLFGLRRLVVLVVVCLVVGACGSGGGDAGEVVVGDPNQAGAVGSGGLGADGVGAVTENTGEGPGEPPVPGGPDDGGTPGPGGPDDGSTGPVSDTGAPEEDGVLPGGYAELISPEMVRGGLVLLPEPTLPVGLVNEVVDLCDDSAAFLMANRRVLGPGEVATEEELFQVLVERVSNEVDCDESGGRRYVYVGDGWSTSGAHPTVADALAHRDRIEARNVDVRKQWPFGVLLGYHGMFNREFPLEERNEVVVLVDTVSVKDGIVRGLVHNLSEKQYARNVVVAIGDLSWRWPLTVQPGERAPFEIESWQGSDNPANIAISVTADMSTNIDISRAFKLGEMRLTPQRGSDVLMVGLLTEPTSPPGLGQLIKQQTIEDIRAYFAIFDNGTERVVELEQVPVGFDVWYGNETSTGARVVPIESFPATVDDLPADLASRSDLTFYFNGGYGYPPTIVFELDVENYTNYDIQAWAGGANPLPP